MSGMRGEGRCLREGVCVYIWLSHFLIQQKLMQHCKEILLQLKKKKRMLVASEAREDGKNRQESLA